MLEIQDILKLLPHSYPFVYLDRIVAIEPGRRGVGIKAVSAGEPLLDRDGVHCYFPSVLIIEACGQLTGIVCACQQRKRMGTNYLAAIPFFRFHHPVEVGDLLRLESVIVKGAQQLIYAEVKAWVGDALAAEGALMVTNFTVHA